MKLTVLVEDETDKSELKNVHGVSFFIQLDDGCKILFDTAQKDFFLQNAKILGIDPLSSDFCVLSHNHYDHSGGVEHLLSHGFNNPIFVHKKFFNEKFSRRNGQLCSSIGIDMPHFNSFQSLHFIKDDLTKIYDGVYLLANVKFQNDFERVNDNFFVKINDDFVQDTFEDELSLIIDLDEWLFVISGCSHRGIINILNSASTHFKKNIFGFIGGTHLIGAEKERLSKTVKFLKDFNLQFLGACHCTGEDGIKYLSENFPKSFVRVKTGFEIQI